jgi:Bacteroidetes VLRF1 release factor/Vms1-associating treble clef domain
MQQQQQHSLFSNQGIVLLKRALELATAAAAAQQQQQQSSTTTTIVYPKSRRGGGNSTILSGKKNETVPGGATGDDDHSSMSSVEGVGIGHQQDEEEEDDESLSASSSAETSSAGSEKEDGDGEDQMSERIKDEEPPGKPQGLKTSEPTSATTTSNVGIGIVPKRNKNNNNNKLPAPTMDKRKRELLVRKHIESLAHTRLPLSSIMTALEENHQEHHQQQQQGQETQKEQPLELCLASALLPKDCRHHHSADDNGNDDQAGDADDDVARVLLTQTRYYLSLAENNLPWVVLFLRSGRFSGAIFQNGACIQHRNLQRYTVRKGQGKAQSAQDASGRRPKSMGAQLRRAGEEALKNDIAATLLHWKDEMQKAAIILISCPKTMRKTLYDCMENNNGNVTIVQRNDGRIRRVPLDLGRPTFENCVIIHDVLVTVTVAAATAATATATAHNTPTTTNRTGSGETENDSGLASSSTSLGQKNDSIPKAEEEEVDDIPLEAIHLAAKNGNLSAIQDLLAVAENDDDDCDHDEEARAKSDNRTDDGGGGAVVCAMVDRVAGVDLMTPLHFAALSTTSLSRLDQQDHQLHQSMEAGNGSSSGGSGDAVIDAAEVAAKCVMELLIRGKANPAKLDARGRPPYFLASHEKVRDAFRMARAQLGEDYCQWDVDAKVGPPLTVDDLTARKEKEAEKKKKKKARQKEKKAKEKAQQEEMEQHRQEEKEKEMQQEEAKRVRDGLAPKNAAAGNNVCDFCQTVCKGRQRSQMFRRLDYNYCTTECLQKHKRELMATAALARLNG